MKKSRVIAYIIIVILMFLFNFYYRPIQGNPKVTEDYKKSNSYINELYASNEHFKEKLLAPEYYYFYDEMLKGLINSETEISIPCLGDSCLNIFSHALEAIILDHPELITFYVGGTYRYKYSSVIYKNHMSLSPFRYHMGVKRIARELENIRRDTKDMNDKEKIIYVYNYVAAKDYDHYFTYNGSNQSAYSFFTKGSTVCAGFAKASQIIFQNIGINSYLVHNSEHMWNYVQYEGKWYVFDATVGACYIKDTTHYYEGLGNTTVDETVGYYADAYPPIETEKLKDLFDL